MLLKGSVECRQMKLLLTSDQGKSEVDLVQSIRPSRCHWFFQIYNLNNLFGIHGRVSLLRRLGASSSPSNQPTKSNSFKN